MHRVSKKSLCQRFIFEQISKVENPLMTFFGFLIVMSTDSEPIIVFGKSTTFFKLSLTLSLNGFKQNSARCIVFYDVCLGSPT